LDELSTFDISGVFESRRAALALARKQAALVAFAAGAKPRARTIHETSGFWIHFWRRSFKKNCAEALKRESCARTSGSQDQWISGTRVRSAGWLGVQTSLMATMSNIRCMDST